MQILHVSFIKFKVSDRIRMFSINGMRQMYLKLQTEGGLKSTVYDIAGKSKREIRKYVYAIVM